MAKSKYYASWSANNGSTYGDAVYASKRKAISEVREICKGNTFQQPNNVSRWEVTDETKTVIAAGYIYNGKNGLVSRNYNL